MGRTKPAKFKHGKDVVRVSVLGVEIHSTLWSEPINRGHLTMDEIVDLSRVPKDKLRRFLKESDA